MKKVKEWLTLLFVAETIVVLLITFTDETVGGYKTIQGIMLLTALVILIEAVIWESLPWLFNKFVKQRLSQTNKE